MKRALLAPALACAALGTAQAAQAQQACIAPEDAADAVIYVMPAAYDAALKRCKSEFTEESFLPSAQGSNFIEQFRTQRDERWGGTFRFLKVFISAQSEGNNAMAETIAGMPEESLRPFADGVLGQLIGEQIEKDTCGSIDRGAELLSPLPAENVGGLVAFILELVELDNPPICGVSGTVKVIPEGPLSE